MGYYFARRSCLDPTIIAPPGDRSPNTNTAVADNTTAGLLLSAVQTFSFYCKLSLDLCSSKYVRYSRLAPGVAPVKYLNNLDKVRGLASSGSCSG